MPSERSWSQLGSLLASPSALRFASVWPAVLLGALGTTLLAPAEVVGGDGLAPFALLNVLWWGSAAGLIIVSGGARREGGDAWRPVAGVVGSMVVGWCLAWVAAWFIGLGAPWLTLVVWLPAASLATVAWLVFVEQRRQGRSARERFAAELADLRGQTEALDEAQAVILREAESVSEAVSAAITSALDRADGGTVDGSQLRSVLDHEVREPVRQASHVIHDVEPRARLAAPRRGERLFTTLDEMAISGRWHALEGYLLVLIASLPNALLNKPQPIGALSEIAADALGWAITIAIAQSARGRSAAWPAIARRTVVPFGFAFGLAIAIMLAYPVGETHLTGELLALTVIVATPGWTVIAMVPALVLYGTSRRATVSAERAAQLAIARLGRDEATTRFRAVQEALVAGLHGRVQGRAIAALAAIDLADTGIDHAAQFVAVALRDLADPDVVGLARRHAEAQSTPAADTIDQVIRIWRHVIDVDLSIPVMPPAGLQRPVGIAIQEALANAVRHGSARHAWIELSGDADRWHLTVRDDGSGPPPTYSVGIGLGQLAGIDWSLTREGDTTVLNVLFTEGKPELDR